MSYVSVEDWDEYFAGSVMERHTLLDETTVDYCCRLEMTMNYPRSSRFKRLVPESRKLVYVNLLEYIKVHHTCIKLTESTIELCKSGYPHMHVTLHCKMTGPYSIEGLLNDIVKTYVSQLPKLTQNSLHKYHYCNKFNCFKCPSILLQWYRSSDSERALVWSEYIKKDIL